MLAVLAAGAFAGLISAPHCALMCGPLGVHAHRSGPQGLARYQLARALSYALVGAGAGLLGEPVVAALWSSSATSALSWALAATLAVAAIRSWPRGSRRTRDSGPLHSIGRRRTPLIARVLQLLPRRPEVLGACTPLLPCAALWSGIVIAASTASPLAGAATMLGFAVASGTAFLASGFLGVLLRGGRGRLRALSALLALGALFFALRPFTQVTHTESGEGKGAAHCPLHAGGQP